MIKKWRSGMNEQRKVTWIIMWITALGQAAVTLYVPAFPAIMLDLNTHPEAVKTTLTIFLLGYGISQFVYGPLSDRYGRKPILLIGIAIFCAGCFANLFVQSINSFFLARLLQGLGIGSVITIGRSVLRDCFSGREFSSAASYLSMGFAIGLGVTPIIGAYLQRYFGWKADFGFLLFIGIIFFLIIWRWLPETISRSTVRSSLSQFFQQTLIEYKRVLCDVSFLQFLLGGIFAYGVVIAYNVMTPFLIQNILQYSIESYGWFSLLVAIPYYIAASMNRSLVLKFGGSPILLFGISLIILAGLLMAATVLYPQLYLVMILLPVTIATFGQALVWPNAISGALQHYAENSGKASAMLSSLQMLIVGILSAVMAALPDVNQLSLAGVLFFLGLFAGVILWSKILRKF
jgi:DHA1 family 2-module integral membrane pump EmrD-like MFS transporter